MHRIEFWYGKEEGESPLIWSNDKYEKKSIRKKYKDAIYSVELWKNGGNHDDYSLLYDLCRLANDYDGINMVDPKAWKNITPQNKPKLVVENGNEKYTINFYFMPDSDDEDENDGFWCAKMVLS